MGNRWEDAVVMISNWSDIMSIIVLVVELRV
jgi:hypothetical protein